MARYDISKSDIRYTNDFKVTKEIKEAFKENGYILLRGLLDKEEMTKLRAALESEDGILKHHYELADGTGKNIKMAMWAHPGNDITGVIARAEKFAGTFEELLGGEIYHYHGKLIMKEPKTGGAHIWHQDYGYWYENGHIFPNMGTVWVGIDKADKENGCLQILVGSHNVGRVDHKRVGDQATVDPERLKQVRKFCPLLHVEVEPGDCLFFHCNIIHTAEGNNSERRRWAYLIAYNRRDNSPVYEHFLPGYTPLQKLPNDAIRSCTTDTCLDGKVFHTAPRSERSFVTLTQKTQALDT